MLFKQLFINDFKKAWYRSFVSRAYIVLIGIANVWAWLLGPLGRYFYYGIYQGRIGVRFWAL